MINKQNHMKSVLYILIALVAYENIVVIDNGSWQNFSMGGGWNYFYYIPLEDLLN